MSGSVRGVEDVDGGAQAQAGAATLPPRHNPAAAKTERLLNLVIALLYTRQALSKARIRSAVPQYADSTDEAFDRMFERDKDELRALGIPLRTEALDAFFDDEAGYRIDRREYELPAIEFTPDEVAVIGVASRAWSQASLAGPAAQALRKLQAAGVEHDEASVAGIEPLLHTKEPAFESVRTATIAGQPIRFGYQRGRGTEAMERHIQPWALTNWHGKWYVTGFDLDRDAARVFRLDRVTSAVKIQRAKPDPAHVAPPDHDPRSMIISASGREPEQTSTVTVRLRPGTGHSVRRLADSVVNGQHEQGEWGIATFTQLSSASLVTEVAGLGPNAVVIDPPEVAAAVRARLEAVLAAHAQGSPAW